MRIVLAIFTDRFEPYSGLSPFIKNYPQYSKLINRINESLSRRKKPFEHEEFTLLRLDVNKPKTCEEFQPFECENYRGCFECPHRVVSKAKG